MTNMEKILMDRDKLSQGEARQVCNTMREEVYDIIDRNGSYDDVEDLLCEYGFEMDYIFDILV